MNWVRFLFSFQGRVNRLQALLGLYGVGFGIMALTVISMFVVPHALGDGRTIRSLPPSSIVLYVVCMVSQLTILVRRAHDVGRSGWLVFWWAAAAVSLNLFVARQFPIAYLVVAFPMVAAAFWMLFSPGQSAANRFGEPPRPGWLP